MNWRYTGPVSVTTGHRPLPTLEPTNGPIDPGIAKAVHWLRRLGFNARNLLNGAQSDTCNIAITCVPEALITESRRLLNVLREIGVNVTEIRPDEKDATASIQASFDPVSNVALIVLSNFLDVDLGIGWGDYTPVSANVTDR